MGHKSINRTPILTTNQNDTKLSRKVVSIGELHNSRELELAQSILLKDELIRKLEEKLARYESRDKHSHKSMGASSGGRDLSSPSSSDDSDDDSEDHRELPDDYYSGLPKTPSSDSVRDHSKKTNREAFRDPWATRSRPFSSQECYEEYEESINTPLWDMARKKYRPKEVIDFTGLDEISAIMKLPPPWNVLPKYKMIKDLEEFLLANPSMIIKTKEMNAALYHPWCAMFIDYFHCTNMSIAMKYGMIRRSFEHTDYGIMIPEGPVTVAKYCEVIVALHNTFGGTEARIASIRANIIKMDRVKDYASGQILYKHMTQYLEATKPREYKTVRYDRLTLDTIYQKLPFNIVRGYVTEITNRYGEMINNIVMLHHWLGRNYFTRPQGTGAMVRLERRLKELKDEDFCHVPVAEEEQKSAQGLSTTRTPDPSPSQNQSVTLADSEEDSDKEY